MKRLFHIINACFCVFPIPLLAQKTEPFNRYSELTPSVETAQMSQFGPVSPSLYTGALSFSLPLQTYQDPDFTLPVSLDYCFDGYRPAVHSGIIGYGWHLNCGGVITREVRGLPDDLRNWDSNTDGFYYATQNSIFNHLAGANPYVLINMNDYPNLVTEGNANKIDIFSDIPVFVSEADLQDPSRWIYDASPDLFHFSFLDYSGYFFFQQDGTFAIFNTSVPQGEITIQFTPLAPESSLNVSRFVITTGEGYQFTFGGDFDAMEYAGSNSGNGLSLSVAAWHLTSITAPNGKQVSFHYSESHRMEKSAGITYSPAVTVTGEPPVPGYWSQSSLETIWFTYYSFTPIMSSVSVNGDLFASFHYKNYIIDENARSFFLDSTKVHLDSGYSALDGIAPPSSLESVFFFNHTGDSINEVTLTKTVVGSARSRVFLTGVQTKSMGTHSFSYASLPVGTTVPYNNTGAVDHWGFWNAGAELTVLKHYLSSAGLSSGGLYQQLTDPSVRQPSFDRARFGALSQITYPTGGSAIIEYEANDAELLIDRNFYSPVGFIENSSNFLIGGVRVKSISTDDGARIRTTQYTYHALNDATKSSGILHQMPRYSARFQCGYSPDPLISYTMTCLGVSTEGYFIGLNDPPVGYSFVQVIHPDESQTQYSFSNINISSYLDWYALDYEGRVDHFIKRFKEDRAYVSHPDDNNWIKIGNVTLPPYEDYRLARGIILSQKDFDASEELKSEVRYKYSFLSSPFHPVFCNNLNDFVRVNICYHWGRLSDRTEYLYDSGGVTTRTNCCFFNSRGQVISRHDYSSNEKNSEYYSYVVDDSVSIHNPSLRSAISKIISVKQLEGEGRFALSQVRMSYSDSTSNPHPTLLTQYSYDTPIRIFGDSSLDSLSINGASARSCQLVYDADYRLTSATLPGDSYIQYAWDDIGTNIIRKEINDPVNVYSYMWKNLVGLTRIVEPTGIYKIYEYDNSNRISKQRNHLGETEVHWQYKIKNE